MSADHGARCPNCSRYAGPSARFCPNCGATLDEPPSPPAVRADVFIVAPRRSFLNQLLRLLLVIWLVAYPVASCGPVIIGASAGGSSGGAAALGGLLLGGVFLIPWLIGLLVLGLLVVLTR